MSDCGRYGLTVIAFVGSVFSSYYHWAKMRGRGDPENHCCINVCLYGPGVRRWTMTERSRASMSRGADHFAVGPSHLRWDGDALTIDIDEWSNPLPRRVRGRIRVHPKALSSRIWALDDDARHHWGPLAPSAAVEVELGHPELRWRGPGYFDSNEGSEPIERPFASWDWSRSMLGDGSTAVIYDVRQKQGEDRLLALRFAPDASVATFAADSRHALSPTFWRIPRHMRSGEAPRLVETLEDTPFYQRAVLEATLAGERALTFHESLDAGRLERLSTRLMLPWRMPRLR
ncbi:MAG: carotenoid 1,2-hydratase [Burkholderiales bacterium]